MTWKLSYLKGKQSKIEPVEAEELEYKLVTKREVYGAKMTAYTGENLDKMVKTYAELRIQSFFYLRASFYETSRCILASKSLWM